jgi:hypothetical protein
LRRRTALLARASASGAGLLAFGPTTVAGLATQRKQNLDTITKKLDAHLDALVQPAVDVDALGDFLYRRIGRMSALTPYTLTLWISDYLHCEACRYIAEVDARQAQEAE